jgi:hypothetical protein|tara:strand:- start:2986 stop:3651 length:666 start_codon:yes stop_codon:yes gene_type:complete
MQTILNSWEEVAAFADSRLRVPPSYLDRVNKRKYPVDAFSLGQLASKAWLLDTLFRIVPLKSNAEVALLGCWIGSIVPFLHRGLTIKRIYGFDIDPNSIALADEFNREHVENDWKFKGVVADMSMVPTNDMQFEVNGQLIEFKPDWVINTSCEHMDTEWFDTADSDQLIIMQTNNSPDFDGHVNTCDSIEEMQARYPLSDTVYVGSITTPAYTRFMQIGYR